jgi:hypothetical protein
LKEKVSSVSTWGANAMPSHITSSRPGSANMLTLPSNIVMMPCACQECNPPWWAPVGTHRCLCLSSLCPFSHSDHTAEQLQKNPKWLVSILRVWGLRTPQQEESSNYLLHFESY